MTPPRIAASRPPTEVRAALTAYAILTVCSLYTQLLTDSHSVRPIFNPSLGTLSVEFGLMLIVLSPVAAVTFFAFRGFNWARVTIWVFLFLDFYAHALAFQNPLHMGLMAADVLMAGWLARAQIGVWFRGDAPAALTPARPRMLLIGTGVYALFTAGFVLAWVRPLLGRHEGFASKLTLALEMLLILAPCLLGIFFLLRGSRWARFALTVAALMAEFLVSSSAVQEIIDWQQAGSARPAGAPFWVWDATLSVLAPIAVMLFHVPSVNAWIRATAARRATPG
jgi:hypothetical protein